jgi:hypothetical protein
LPRAAGLIVAAAARPTADFWKVLLPAATEGSIPTDDAGQFLAADLAQAELNVEHLAFRIQVFEVAGDAVEAARLQASFGSPVPKPL